MKTYLVGGAVRDQLLGKTPKDRDWVVVGASQADLDKMLAEGYAQVGADFPVFLHPKTGEEYALARIERKNGVGYHGFVLSTDDVSIEEDLARRDLTINSMAMDTDGTIVDPYGGVRDLHNHVLRHTTSAFAEDPLRVLRLARFAARLPTWKVADETLELCYQLSVAGELNHLSIERIWVEMEKGFSEESPKRFLEMLSLTGALEHCTVLAEIFGSHFSDPQWVAGTYLNVIPVEQRLHVSVAVLATPESKLPGAPSRVRECLANLNAVRAFGGTAEDLCLMLKRAKALSDGTAFPDFVMAVSTLEHAGFHLPFCTKQLMTGAHIIRRVRAADFPGIEGKALGEAIDKQRIVNLELGVGKLKHLK